MTPRFKTFRSDWLAFPFGAFTHRQAFCFFFFCGCPASATMSWLSLLRCEKVHVGNIYWAHTGGGRPYARGADTDSVTSSPADTIKCFGGACSILVRV